MAVDPAHAGVVYAATRTGTYKSVDRGTTWMIVDHDTVFRADGDAALVVDGNGWVFLGHNGIRRSQDGGDTWASISDGLDKYVTGTYSDTTEIAFDPNAAGTIYAVQSLGSLLKTTSGGAPWTHASTPSGNSYLQHVALVAERPGRIFVTEFNSFWRSDNAGATWKKLDIRASISPRVLVDPFQPDTVYAGTLSGDYPNGISRDGGNTWQAFSTPANGRVVPDPTRPLTLFALPYMTPLPFTLQFDATMSRVRDASLVSMPGWSVVADDPSGAIYAGTSTVDGLQIAKLAPR